MTNKKAVLVVSFGTTYAQTRVNNIEALEKAICAAVPERTFYRAWTSGKIIRKLKSRDDLHVNTVPEALACMLADGVTDVLIQPTHILNGIENDIMLGQIEEVCGQFESVLVGDPLLTSAQDITAMANIIGQAYADRSADTALVLMGHGTEHDVNTVYATLHEAFTAQGYNDIHVGTVEAHPDVDDVLAAVKQTAHIKQVILAPFMIVAGDHATNDMAGDEDDAWKVIFQNAGYGVTCVLRGLGEYEGVAPLFVAHATEE